MLLGCVCSLRYVETLSRRPPLWGLKSPARVACYRAAKIVARPSPKDGSRPIRVTPAAAGDRRTGRAPRNRDAARKGPVPAPSDVSHQLKITYGPTALWCSSVVAPLGAPAAHPGACRFARRRRGQGPVDRQRCCPVHLAAHCHAANLGDHGSSIPVRSEAQPRRSMCDGVAGDALEATRLTAGPPLRCGPWREAELRFGVPQASARHDPAHAGGK